MKLKHIPITKSNKTHEIIDEIIGEIKIPAELEEEIATGWAKGIRYELVGSYEPAGSNNATILNFNIVGIAAQPIE